MDVREKLLKILGEHESFSLDIQKKIGRDRAVVYSVYLLENMDIEPTFQRICVASFKLFHESFSFVEFPEYPDSRVIRNCLFHCVYKTKGWLIGSDKTKYSITDKARDEVIPIFEKMMNSDMTINQLPEKYIKRRGPKKDLTTRSTDKEGLIIKEIKESKGFALFTEKKDEIKSLHVKQSLGGDRYVSEAFLRKKLNEAIEAANLFEDDDVKLYLKWIKDNISDFIK